MTRARSVAALMAVAATVALGACAAPPPVASPSGAAASSASAPDMLAAVNAQRAANGKAALALCGPLILAAETQSAAQAAQMRMHHSQLAALANSAGYFGWLSLGENVAAGQTSVDQVMTAWMNSSGHKANILGSYTHAGFAQATGANGVIYWTQEFGSGGSC